MSFPGTSPAYTAWVTIRFEADFWVIGWLTCAADSMTTLSVDEAGSFTFTPPVCVWKNACTPLAWAAAQIGSKSDEEYGFGGVAGRRMPRNWLAAALSICATASST